MKANMVMEIQKKKIYAAHGWSLAIACTQYSVHLSNCFFPQFDIINILVED